MKQPLTRMTKYIVPHRRTFSVD